MYAIFSFFSIKMEAMICDIYIGSKYSI